MCWYMDCDCDLQEIKENVDTDFHGLVKFCQQQQQQGSPASKLSVCETNIAYYKLDL